MPAVTALAAPLYIATGVLIVAGLAKSLHPSATAGALRELSVPSPLLAARVLGVAEVIIGVAAIATGHWLTWAGVGAGYLGFTIFAVWALRDQSRIGSCGCFGREDTPVTPGHLAFNAAAATVAAFAVFDPVELSSFDGSPFEAVLAALLIAAGVWLSVIGLTVLPRTLVLASGSSAPVVPEFSLDSPTTPRGTP